jgi:hypothetical protein
MIRDKSYAGRDSLNTHNRVGESGEAKAKWTAR